MPYIALYLILL